MFSFTPKIKLEWLVVPKIPVWKRRRFVTFRIDGPWAALADLPSVYVTTPRSVITGKDLTRPGTTISLARYDGDFLALEDLIQEAYEDHTDIYADVERGVDGYVWGERVDPEGGEVTEYFYILQSGSLSVGVRQKSDA